MATANQPVVLITGCSTGIGRALATEFAGRGRRVMATARDLDSLQDLASETVATARLDVTSEASIAEAVAACLDWAGRIDLLINNAGYALIGPMTEVRLGDLANQYETNVVGLVAVIQAVAPAMIERRSGRIVNIGSVSGITATPFGGSYSGTKAAVHLISDSLRMELAPFGIEVITVQPGGVQSDFGKRASTGIERFRENSRFAAVAESIEARAMASQAGGMPTADFARWLVREVTADRPRAVLRAGTSSALLPALARLPVRLRDRFLSRKFGLDRLRQA